MWKEYYESLRLLDVTQNSYYTRRDCVNNHMKKSSVAVVSIYYSLIYMSGGAFASYISLYYSSINLDNTQIGILSSISALVALVSQPLWGVIGDRARLKNRILYLCLFLSAITIWLMPLSGSAFWLLGAASVIFFFFQCAISPLSDAMALELAAREGYKFSRVRTAGSLGFAVMAGIAGKIFENGIDYIFAVFSVIMLLTFFISLMIPPVQGHQREGKKVSMLEILKDKKLLYIYIYVFILSSTLGYFMSFHAVYSTEMGISTQIVGIGIMVGSFSQFPFMIFFDGIYKRIGVTKIILFSGVIYGLRWLLSATLLNSFTVILIWVLHGFTYIVLYLCLAEYIADNIPAEFRTRGQMMNSIILMGISKIAGSSIGGYVSSAIGIRNTLFICSAISFAAVAGFYALVKLSPVFTQMRMEKGSTS